MKRSRYDIVNCCKPWLLELLKGVWVCSQTSVGGLQAGYDKNKLTKDKLIMRVTSRKIKTCLQFTGFKLLTPKVRKHTARHKSHCMELPNNGKDQRLHCMCWIYVIAVNLYSMVCILHSMMVVRTIERHIRIFRIK